MVLDGLFIKEALSECTVLYERVPINPLVVVDSRAVQKGSMFVALCGARQDGHAFIADALKRGAGAIIMMRSKLTDEIETYAQRYHAALVLVDDSLQALCRLAQAWRARFSIPIVGVTGSVGKTSTKEILGAIAHAAGMNCLVSSGNQNTQIGVALNVLKLRPDHELAVFEMGISRPGEMKMLAGIVRPSVAVITSIGHSHMEGLGSLQDIAAEKRDIFSYFTQEHIGIIDGDSPLLAPVSYVHPVVRFGFKTTNQIQARKVRIVDVSTRCILKLYQDKYPIVINKPHRGSVSNALAAAAVAHVLGISHQAIVEGAQKPITVAGRFERKLLRSGTGVLINDCYNANPESMKAALQAFEHIATRAQKIVVIGDMLELGVNSPFWHRQVGRIMRKLSSLHHVILVGTMVKWTKNTLPRAIKVTHVDSWEQAVPQLESSIKDKESMVLVKGSFGVGLLNLVKQCSIDGTS